MTWYGDVKGKDILLYYILSYINYRYRKSNRKAKGHGVIVFKVGHGVWVPHEEGVHSAIVGVASPPFTFPRLLSWPCLYLFLRPILLFIHSFVIQFFYSTLSILSLSFPLQFTDGTFPICPPIRSSGSRYVSAHASSCVILFLFFFIIHSLQGIVAQRDDLSGMQLSGNKVRKLEFLMADAVAQGADSIITIGGIQSNHCRATAVAAKYLNLDCFLILRTSNLLVDRDPGLTGNLLVERLAGAHVHLISKEEYSKIGSVVSLLNWSHVLSLITFCLFF